MMFLFTWPSGLRGEDVLRNRPTGNKNCLRRSCLLTDRDKINNLYREPAIDASYYASGHLDKRFQRRRFFRNRPIRKKNCSWQPCLFANRDEISNLYREPSSFLCSVFVIFLFAIVFCHLLLLITPLKCSNFLQDN